MIPKAQLIEGRWYAGRGRHSDVARWVRIGRKPGGRLTFVTVGMKMHQPAVYDLGHFEDGGCFEPQQLIG